MKLLNFLILICKQLKSITLLMKLFKYKNVLDNKGKFIE